MSFLNRFNLGLRGGLYATLAGLALLPALAAGLFWLSSKTLDATITDIAERKMLALSTASLLERQARDAQLAQARMQAIASKAELENAASSTRLRLKDAAAQVGTLAELGLHADTVKMIGDGLASMEGTIDKMAKEVGARIAVLDDRRAAIAKLNGAAEEFARNLAPSILRWRATANQVRARLAGGGLEGEALAGQIELLGKALGMLDPLNDLALRGRNLETLLAQVPSTDQPDRLPVIELRVKEEIGRIQAGLEKVDPRLKAAVEEQVTTLLALGSGDASLLALQQQLIKLDRSTRDLITIAEAVSGEVTGGVASTFASTEGQVRESVGQAGEAMVSLEITQMLAAGSALAIAILAALFYVRPRIVNRLIALAGTMRSIADGDLTAEVPEGGRDEITEMASAVRVFRANAIENERLAREAEENRRREEEARRREAEREEAERRAAEERRLQQEAEKREAEKREREAEERRRAEREQERVAAEARRKQDLERLAAEFEQAVGQVVSGVATASNEMQSLARRLTGVVGDTRQRTTEVASASRQSSESISAVAAATEEVAVSIREISRQVSDSSQMTSNAARQADRTNSDINGLAEAANRIGAIVEVINGIAGQTNLLALNATIEAARAGEAGKGFAVVASEVKSLATQTAKATGEVGQQIDAIQSLVRQSVDAIRAIGGTVTRINEATTSIAGAVEQQGAAMGEISRSVQEAAQGSNLVTGNMDAVQGAAEDTGGVADAVSRAAQELSSNAEALRVQVDGFLGKVRAA
ncbi:methyl-accepting chemotaxis protein [Desertibaculum subflavum]|uniref:methyl-accepting chemotaxis protein n=1 Tax=Desertibaculum subflavum TaxID=2268458 RepID=UPI000E666441